MNIKKNFLFLAFSIFVLPIFGQSRPIITDLNVIPKEQAIKLSWNLPQNSSIAITGYSIFKDTKQISSYEQLSILQPIVTLASDVNTFTDNVSDFCDYYYAVICNTEKGPYVIILPSINTTITGVKAVLSSSKEQIINTPKNSDTHSQFSLTQTQDASEKMRYIPLPTPGLIELDKPKNKILGQKAIDAGNSLSKGYNSKTNKITRMHIFEEDMVSPEGGDDYFLFAILKNSFAKKNFSAAIVELSDFLSVHRSDETTSRATFYLGESYYFSKNYSEALFNFLAVKEVYPELSKKWIDSSLDLIELKTNKN